MAAERTRGLVLLLFALAPNDAWSLRAVRCARARGGTLLAAACADSRGFFDMYPDDELAALLSVHSTLFPDSETSATSGSQIDGDEGSAAPGGGSLHDLVLGALAETRGAHTGEEDGGSEPEAR